MEEEDKSPPWIPAGILLGLLLLGVLMEYFNWYPGH